MTNLREEIAVEVKARGVAVVARELGMARATVLSYLAHVERDATEALVKQRDAERRVAKQVAQK